jgi:hypothetical protein
MIFPSSLHFIESFALLVIYSYKLDWFFSEFDTSENLMRLNSSYLMILLNFFRLKPTAGEIFFPN